VAAAKAVDSADWQIGGGGGEGEGMEACEFVELGRLLVAIAGKEAVVGATDGRGDDGGKETPAAAAAAAAAAAVAAAAAGSSEVPGRCEAALLACLTSH